MPADRPTPAEKADAADRFITELNAAGAAIGRARQILLERAERGSTIGPLFSLTTGLPQALDAASARLSAAHRIAGVHAYDAHREAGHVARDQAATDG